MRYRWGKSDCEAAAARPKLPPIPDTRNEDTPCAATRSAALPSGAAAIGALAIAAFAAMPSRAAEDAVKIPPPAADAQAADGMQTAVLAGGCFWGVQGVFQHTAGVTTRSPAMPAAAR